MTEENKSKVIYFCIYAVITYILLELLGFALSWFIFRVWGEGHGTIAFLLGTLVTASSLLFCMCIVIIIVIVIIVIMHRHYNTVPNSEISTLFAKVTIQAFKGLVQVTIGISKQA